MRKEIPLRFLLSFFILLAGISASSQRLGDYRSRNLIGNVDLNLTLNWEKYVSTVSGNDWVLISGLSLPAPAQVMRDFPDTSFTVTIQAADFWFNVNEVVIPAGITIIHKGSNGTFETDASKKITLNGTYVHNTAASVNTILSGMVIGSTSTFKYRGSSVLGVTGVFSGISYGNLAFELEEGGGSYSPTLGAGSDPMTVRDTLSIGAGVSLAQGSNFTGSLNLHNIRISGSMALKGFTPTGSQFAVNSGGTFTIPSGETVTLNANITTAASSNVIVNGAMNCGGYSITGGGNVTVNGTLRTGHANGLSGSLAATGTIGLGGSSLVEYMALGAQTVTARADYANMLIAGSGTKTLGGHCVLSGDLSINNSMLDLGDYHLTLGGNVSSYSSTSYIKTSGTGKLTLKNIGANNRVFPVGRNSYNPVTISGGSGRDWSVHVKDSVENLPAALQNKEIKRTWDVSHTGSALTEGPLIKFQYNAADPKGSAYTTGMASQIINFHDGQWVTAQTQVPVEDLSTIHIVTLSNGYTQFSPFAITNTTGALPVRFSRFEAKANERSVQLSFANETEDGVIRYEVERSTDGRHFKPIGTVLPLANNGRRASYTYTDPLMSAGHHFYRIKAVLLTGKTEYSAIVRVQEEVKVSHLQVYPNPVSGGKLLLKKTDLTAGTYQLSIFNEAGQEVTKLAFTHSGGNLVKEVSTAGLKGGFYYLQLKGSHLFQLRFVVQ